MTHLISCRTVLADLCLFVSEARRRRASQFTPEGRVSGPDLERKSYSSYVAFQDPDGSAWIVQGVTRRAAGRIDPATTTFQSANNLASALRRAAAAHDKFEKNNGTSTQTGRLKVGEATASVTVT